MLAISLFILHLIPDNTAHNVNNKIKPEVTPLINHDYTNEQYEDIQNVSKIIMNQGSYTFKLTKIYRFFHLEHNRATFISLLTECLP